eukprot:g502.t1
MSRNEKRSFLSFFKRRTPSEKRATSESGPSSERQDNDAVMDSYSMGWFGSPPSSQKSKQQTEEEEPKKEETKKEKTKEEEMKEELTTTEPTPTDYVATETSDNQGSTPEEIDEPHEKKRARSVFVKVGIPVALVTAVIAIVMKCVN